MAVAMMGCIPAVAQVVNLASFDRHVVHYGIQIGYTQSKFDLIYTEDDEVRGALQGTTSYYTPGFHVAIIGDLRLTNFVNVRLLPGITIINRQLSYSWNSAYAATHRNVEDMRQVESVYGEIPLDFKLRSMRWRNMRPYLTLGASYGFDFASMRNNKNNNNQSIVRLATSDFRCQTGVGFDFYMRYVKFAIELKVSFGIPDLRVEDDDLYTRSVEALRTRTFIIGFTFEG